ncbi:protein CHUP1, chloroplastic [Capsicum annuum]
MENNTTKVDIIKPVFIKAGIPIAITLVGYIIAKITTKKLSKFQISPIQGNPHDESGHQNLENLESLSFIENNDYDHDDDSLESLDQFQENPHELSCSESPEIFQHPCRILQKCNTLEGSDTQSMKTFMKSLSNTAHEASRNDNNDHHSACRILQKCTTSEGSDTQSTTTFLKSPSNTAHEVSRNDDNDHYSACRILQKCTTSEGSDTQPMMTFLKSPSNTAHEVSRNDDNDHYSACRILQKCTTSEGSDTQPMMTFLKSPSNTAHEVSRNNDNDHYSACRILQNYTTLEGCSDTQPMTFLKIPSNTAHAVPRNDNDHYSTCTLYRDLQEKCKIQEDSEAKFQQYIQLKEKEIALMDMQHKLLLEINKVDYFCKEITLMEGENQRFQYMVIEYLRIMELLDLSKSENSLLHKKVKKLLKKIKEQKFQLEVKEIEITRNQEGLEIKDHVIKQMELEIQQLKMEKNEVEVVTMEDHKELVNELEQLQKEKASEDKELIYLKWCNACLRHELMRRNQEQMNNPELKNLGEENREIVEEFAPKVHEIILRRSSSVGHNESYSNNEHSKRKKLIQKFKKVMF